MTLTPAAEQIVHVNGVDLCVQTFGPAEAEPMLLLAGAACTMLYWDDEFCARLAAGPRFVLRYDQRDTGRSTCCPPGAPDYTPVDLAADALGLLDAYRIERAHLVGLSFGGGLAQFLAFEHPDRVASLTLVATSPAGPGSGAGLPSMSAATRAAFAAVTEPDWTDREQVIDYLVGQERLCAARSIPFDTAGMRATTARVLDRSSEPRSMFNHFMIVGGGLRHRLAEITAPTLVLHGDEDPVLPPPHGVALATEIPGARLVTVPAMGHEWPRRVWTAMLPEILTHTEGVRMVR